jgi:Lar family restriction alleviation protein
LGKRKIKPCPFCEYPYADVEHTVTMGRATATIERFEVKCYKCGARGPCCLSRDAAIKGWNQRAKNG